MKKIIIILISISVIAAVVAVILTFYSSSQAGSELDEFAKCLASKNITMYGTPWCSWCQKQETLFGKSFRLISFVDCSKNPQECVSKGINGTPAWIFPDSRKIESYLTLEQLSQESGCQLPK